MRPALSGLIATLLSVAVVPAPASEIDGFAAMGASETAGLPSDYKGSWVPYFVNQRGLNFGGTGNPYNVAVGGATSATLLTQEQHTDVAALVQSGDVDVSFMSIGGNDFSKVNSQIASAKLTGQALTDWAQGVTDNIITAMDTVLAAHPLGMIVTSMPDVTLTPGGRAIYDTPIEIERGQAAVDLVDSLLRPAVLSRGYVYVDYANAMRSLNEAPLVVGGVPIDVVIPSSDPTHFFQDGVHPAAVGNGLVANLFLEAVNIGFGTEYVLLTDLEILTIAGLASSYSGETSNLPYADYVVFHWGDANGDGFVDGGDYTVWADHYFQTDQGWAGGDFTRDGIVDGGDYTVWADHYSPAPSAAALVVPEPASLSLLFAGTAALVYGRRWRAKQVN